MALSTFDLTLAVVARYLLGQDQTALATLLMSCEIVEDTYVRPSNLWVRRITLRGPRVIYEMRSEFMALNTRDVNISPSPDRAPPDSDAAILYAAFETIEFGNNPLRMVVQYGAPTRDAATQTEIYMYVFGADPVAQQVQVFSIQSLQHPGRQLIVAPIAELPVEALKRDDSLCFVLMPFAPQLQEIYDHAIKTAVTSTGMECRRADDITQSGEILGQIWSALLHARLVVADLTGANGNVLYELGLAHVLGHQAILLTQNINDVPFDLRHQRHIVYTPHGSGLLVLRDSLAAAIGTALASS